MGEKEMKNKKIKKYEKNRRTKVKAREGSRTSRRKRKRT
jgi:hypothetical protein